MPAYFDCGFSVREPMWHGLGAVLDDYPTSWAEARTLAGLDWEPELVGVRAEDDDAVLDGFKLIRRDDDHTPLGVRTDAFSLVSHADMGVIIEAIMADSAVRFETAGSVKGGKSVWALARIDEPLIVTGDDTPTYPFIAVVNHHDGTGACRVTNSQVRIVCWNTMQMNEADADRSGRQFVFRHSGDVLGRIEEAREALAGCRSDAIEWHETCEQLVKIRTDDRFVAKFLSEFLPTPPKGLVSDRVLENHAQAVRVFKGLLDGPTVMPHEHNAYGLFQASTEYLDHLRGYSNRDTYLGRTLLRSEPLKARSMATIRKLARTA